MKKFKIPDIEKETTVTKTIRIKQNLVEELEELASKNNITFNRLVLECIKFAIENLDETQKEKEVTRIC